MSSFIILEKIWIDLGLNQGPYHKSKYALRLRHRPTNFLHALSSKCTKRRAILSTTKPALSPSLNCERQMPHSLTPTPSKDSLSFMRPSFVFRLHLTSICPMSEMLVVFACGEVDGGTTVCGHVSGLPVRLTLRPEVALLKLGVHRG